MACGFGVFLLVKLLMTFGDLWFLGCLRGVLVVSGFWLSGLGWGWFLWWFAGFCGFSSLDWLGLMRFASCYSCGRVLGFQGLV